MTDPAVNSTSSSWSPDGKRIAFLSNRDQTPDVYAMDAEGSNVMRLTHDAAREFSPRWSPDGRLLAYSSDRDGRREIYVLRPDGAAPFRVTNDAADIDGRLTWTPDGRIAFFATHKGQRTGEGAPALLWTVRPDGTGLAPVTEKPAREFNPTWSPDGRQYAFDAHQQGAWESDDGRWEVWTREANGTGKRQLTKNSVNDWGPAWSPDGKWIAYCCGINDRYEIWVMKANGAEAKRLTHLVYDGAAPGEKSAQGKPTGMTRSGTTIKFGALEIEKRGGKP